MTRLRWAPCVWAVLSLACSPKAHTPSKAHDAGKIADAANATARNADGGRPAASAATDGGAHAPDARPVNAQPCSTSSDTVLQLPTSDASKVDVLFVIDNSDSMADKQVALRAQLPSFVAALTSGDLDGDGQNDVPAASDVHLGVVTSDLGLPGVDGIANCQGLGQDGVLQHTPRAGSAGCLASYPAFLSYQAGVGTAMQTAQDLACIAQVGTGGCGFEHQLEAALKALWPSVDPMAAQNGGQNRISFLGDPTSGKGTLGHGDVENVGFLHNDPQQGLSVIAVVVLSDEDDCSSANTLPFTPPQYLDPNDPVVMEGMNVRCHYNQSALYPIERYVNGLKALRPGNENLVVFAAIVGVPADLTSTDARSGVDFSKASDRDQYYRNILGDPRMQEVVDTHGTADPSDDSLQHSCIIDPQQATIATNQRGAADPPIRIVRVASGFGENGVVQSLCQNDLGPVVGPIVEVIAKQLGASCLPRPLTRGADGLVGCEVTWELPSPGTAPVSTPVECGTPGFEFLLPPAAGEPTTSSRGGQICRVAQLAVQDAGGAKSASPTVVDGTTFSEGWYYDDFSDGLKRCANGGSQRIAFTNGAKPPTSVVVKLTCSSGVSVSNAGACGTAH
jgi:hypothetical protein